MKTFMPHTIMNQSVKMRLIIFCTAIAVLVSFGCTTTEKVRMDPKVNLTEYQTIGIIEFSGNSKENLEPMVTQNFMQSVQTAQPNVRFLELGTEIDLLREVNRSRLDSKSVKAIGKSYEVDAVFTGNMNFSEVKPSFNLSTDLRSLSAKAYVEGTLNTRLWESKNGATRWTKASISKKSVANVGVSEKGPVSFGVNDPNEKYADLINGLVKSNTRDFYPYYVTRTVKK